VRGPDTRNLYRPLREREVRLIKIKPRRQNAPLECELEVFQAESVNRWPAFVALSYVWGSPDDTVSINLNGQVFRITRNLYHALYQIREWSADINVLLARLNAPYLNLLWEPRYQAIFGDVKPGPWFWVDAICINQADMAEKEHLVPRMKDVYANAARVLCWLGPIDEMAYQDERAAQGVHGLFNVCNHIHAHAVAQPNDGTDIREWLSKYALVDLLGPKLNTFADVLVSVLRRPWFSRVWTIQEAILSAMEPVFGFGTATVVGQALWHAVLALDVHLPPPREPILRRLAMSGVEELRMAKSGRIYSEIMHHQKETPTLRGLAKSLGEIFHYTTVNYKCAVPHDMIYGTLSLADTSILPKELAPNYTLPYARVYYEYFRFIAQHTGNLSLLSTFKNELEGVPSWVPDFRYRDGFLAPPVELGSVTFSKDGQQMNVDGVQCGRCVAIHGLVLDKSYSAQKHLLSLTRMATKSFEMRGLTVAQGMLELSNSFGYEKSSTGEWTYVTRGDEPLLGDGIPKDEDSKPADALTVWEPEEGLVFHPNQITHILLDNGCYGLEDMAALAAATGQVSEGVATATASVGSRGKTRG
jgi:hypothetical protein